MPDFSRMQYLCEKSSAVSQRLVDEFLLYLCAHEEGFDKKFDGMLANYLNVISIMPEDWPFYLKSQYVVFQLFRERGLASKYLNHPQVRRRSPKELEYLKFQIEHPWRFVFCRIEQNPKGNFFEMEDILTDENFMLYSDGIAETEKKQGFMSLYFLLRHGFPHFAKCFYHTEKQILSLNAMTDRGYAKLVKALNQSGYKIPTEPEIRVTMAMSMIVKEVLGREITLNPYERLFREEPSPGAKKELDKINHFLKKLMDALNSGKDYDLRELAFGAGIEFETAREIEGQILTKLRKL